MEQKVYFWERNKNNTYLPGGVKMRIAICDLDKGFMARLKKIIYSYAELHKMDLVAECFVSGEKIIENPARYNMVFSDNLLQGMTGIEMAARLREQNSSLPIIFVSDRIDFIYDAFKVGTFRFLRKSNLETELYNTLDEYFRKFGSDHPMWIKVGRDTVFLHTDEIYYVEADNKHCKIHLEDKTLDCSRTMAKVCSILPKNQFCKTNRAFIVNLNHIRRYNNDVIEMKNGVTLHPSRKYYKDFKEEFRQFLRPYEL